MIEESAHRSMIESLSAHIADIRRDLSAEEWEGFKQSLARLVPQEHAAADAAPRQEFLTDLHAVLLQYPSAARYLPRHTTLLPEPPSAPRTDPSARPIFQRLQDVVAQIEQMEWQSGASDAASKSASPSEAGKNGGEDE